MKPALFYAIRRNLHNTVVAVTSTKPGRYGEDQWHGRDTEYNESTHGKMNDLIGRFDTPEEAQARRATIAAISKRYTAERTGLTDQIRVLYRAEREEIDALT